MKVKPHEYQLLKKTLSTWQKQGLLDEQKHQELKQSLVKSSFDWQSLTFYSFIFAIICLSIATIALLADNWLMQLIDRIIETPPLFKSGVFALISAALFWWGIKKRNQQPEKLYSNEAIMFLGVISVASSLSFLGIAFDNGSGRFSVLILLATIVYGFLGLWLRSQLIWLFALISLGAWFGTETGYLSQWKAYFLGMNYPLRYALLGLGMVIGAYFLNRIRTMRSFVGITLQIGLLHLFISLWLLSIFGNMGDWESWIQKSQWQMLGWAMLLGVASVLAIILGLKKDSALLKNYGIAFLFINIYTRYIEFGWDTMHKAVFFTILGLSFWLLGRKAEKIWTLTENKLRL